MNIVSIEGIEVMRGTIWESEKDQWEEEAGQRSKIGAYIHVYMNVKGKTFILFLQLIYTNTIGKITKANNLK